MGNKTTLYWFKARKTEITGLLAKKDVPIFNWSRVQELQGYNTLFWNPNQSQNSTRHKIKCLCFFSNLRSYHENDILKGILNNILYFSITIDLQPVCFNSQTQSSLTFKISCSEASVTKLDGLSNLLVILRYYLKITRKLHKGKIKIKLCQSVEKLFV